jgi:Mn2+/Fe2+ NRAMP family transporter
VANLRSQRTIGEVVFAAALSAVAAALAAIAGFAGAAVLCGLLPGEAGESGLILAPASALVVAAVVFTICYRKIVTYGEGS